MKKLLLLSIATILSLGFVSCSDDENSNPATSTKKILTKLSFDGDFYEFEYDSSNKLVKILYKDIENGTESLSETETITYDSQNRPLKVVRTQPTDIPADYEYINFKYSKDSVFAETKARRTIGSGMQYANMTDTLIINNSGYIVKSLSTSSNEQLNYFVYYKSTYTYDANNNPTKQEVIIKFSAIQSTNTTTITRTFDTKLSVLSNQTVPVWLYNYVGGGYLDDYIGKNNTITLNEISGSDTTTDNYTIAYDQDGYPTKRSLNTEDEDSATFSYKIIE